MEQNETEQPGSGGAHGHVETQKSMAAAPLIQMQTQSGMHANMAR